MERNVKNIKIGLDFDGVIIDHTENKIRFGRELGFDIRSSQTPGYRLRKIVGDENYRKIQKYIYGPGTPAAPLMKDAAVYLKKLKAASRPLFLVSRRSVEYQNGAEKWLAENLPRIFDDGSIFFVAVDEDKNKICRKMGIGIFLDDKVSVLENLTVPHRCLFDPYGIRNDYDLKNIRPVASWREFSDRIKNLYKLT